MPFELGLAVAWAKIASPTHRWVVLEEVPHRLTKSLSDLNGTDPLIHRGNAEGVLKALSNALYRNANSPDFGELETIYRDLKGAASKLGPTAKVAAYSRHRHSSGSYWRRNHLLRNR
jgi:hypothetical protein